jgi:glycosyltransferase involved in cell wall biosynthesis/SAM-dependent methyltransferase
MTNGKPYGDSSVSVIITCYNQARFLDEAIGSLIKQSQQASEIIVVDDGSSDNTKEIAESYPGVIYIFQFNAGLSSARNTGLDHCSGDYIVFLDADDWLYPEALQTNLELLKGAPDAAFVSGWHNKVDEYNNLIPNDEPTIIEGDHYLNLLKGNYIGMHAAVMYRRSILEKFRFDANLNACEDYDLYLRITREYPVINHYKKIAAYRIHGANMSGKIPFMLEKVLEVCRRQEKSLKSDDERKALKTGVQVWNDYYSEKLYKQLMYHPAQQDNFPSQKEAEVLIRNKPLGFVKLSLKKTRDVLKSSLKKSLPDPILKTLHTVGAYDHYTPSPGNVNPGDFERTTPFSYDFGFDRGGAIDRYYIENFLEENKQLVKGRVLEIGDNEYTLRYGENRIDKSDILHVDDTNTKATFIGDISNAPHLPSNAFDCIILTQTLHLIYDFKGALSTCYRILKPGGTLLMTVPGISHIDHGAWRDYWLWSFTDKSIKNILSETFPQATSDIQTFGNVYVAAAFLYGMGLPEIKKYDLDKHDPSYQVIIAARAIRL